ncbi:hypothetical protein [Deinococcus sp. S9]|uniref:hypothetical protein n=1 Tax=Deinococcus sp. S9 TaxID=2545754 RepID=UPI0010558489|nr:hypothetical protein [Deinococcus sp. S9]TDE87364.1 hypothetical protein E0686_02405 [Deinococcus sp. S9]
MKTKAKKAISDLHPHLSWEHRAVLDYIHRHTPTKEELLAASGDPKYTTEGRLRELKKFGFVRGEQAIKEGGGRGRFGPVTYYVTDLALGIVPAGTEVKE